MYKVGITVYKDPSGKTLKGPTLTHFLGDLGGAFGVIGILAAILNLMESRGIPMLIGSIVLAVVGIVLYVVLHKKAKKDAEAAIRKSLSERVAQEELKRS